MLNHLSLKSCLLAVLMSILWSATGVCRQADSSSVEWIEVYFNMPADHSVAMHDNLANDEADLLHTLITRIDSANYSIDLSIYNLEHHEVGQALARAADRGVRVRVVTDYYNRYRHRELGEAMWSRLASAGIYSIDDAGEVYTPDGEVEAPVRLPGASYDMHNKFAVFDALSEDPEDDYVWTGSMNLTYTGPINSNNTIVIKDSGIASAYTMEFNQMWGGPGNRPDPFKARFHKDKAFIGETHFYVDSTKVELFFAPINRDRSKPSPGERLHELVSERARHDLNFLAFAITHDIPMSRAMWERSFSDSLVLRGLIDPRFYAQYRNSGVIWASPEAQIGTRNILPARELRTLHHKVLLIDVMEPYEFNEGIAVAGSYNYSRNAEENNDENLLIFHDERIANQYYQDFMGAMNRAERKWHPPVPEIDTEQWYAVTSVGDANRIEIELSFRFNYPVRFLGVDAPRIYAGEDSSEFYAGEAAEFLSELLNEKEVKLTGYDGGLPDHRYGSFRAYVEARDSSGAIINVNAELLKKGYGEWTPYFRQNADSIAAYRRYERIAKGLDQGMWKQPEQVGRKIPRVIFGSDRVVLAVEFPININTANVDQLQALSGIGPAYAERIIAYRLENGPFRDVEELRNIRGIGPVTMERLRPYVTTE